jgi:hypothetical protein
MLPFQEILNAHYCKNKTHEVLDEVNPENIRANQD